MKTSRTHRAVRRALGALALGATLLPQTPAHAHDPTTTCLDPTIWEGLEWAYNAYYPSDDNPLRLPRSPLTEELTTGDRNEETERTLVLFGDLYPMQQDAPPIVHDELRELFAGADLVVGNVESRIESAQYIDVDRDQTGNFVSTTRFLKSVMAQYCMDPQKTVFSIANNHAGDLAEGHEDDPEYGWNQSLNAVAELESWGTQVVGVGPEDQDEDHPHPLMRVQQWGELRIGVVGWTQVENAQNVQWDWRGAYCLDQGWATTEDVLAVDWAEVKQTHGIDLLIGSVHWQDQFRYFPEYETVHDGHVYLEEQGFDVIAGHGPSVLQPADEQHAELFYSLGVLNTNFAYLGSTKLVSVLELTVDAHGNPVEYTVHPFATRRVDDRTLPQLVDCGDYWAYDFSLQARDARWEIVPLSELDSSTRAELDDELYTVYE